MHRRPLTARAYESKRLRELARRARGRQVLDVGYARGVNARLLADDREVTGLDLEATGIPTGYQRHIRGDVFLIRDLDDGRRYDTIVAGEFIEHVETPYELLHLFADVLAPGGRLILSTPNPVAFPVVLFEWMCSRSRFYTENHTFYFPPRWVMRMLVRTGWHVDEVAPVGLWPLGLPCPVGLSYQVIYVASR